MSDNSKLADDIAKGVQANNVLTNREFKQAFIGIKGILIEQFIGSEYNESDDRDEIWRKLQSLQWVEDQLTEVIQAGKIAGKQLEDRENTQ